MNEPYAAVDWTELREFAAVDLAQSFALSWYVETGTLMLDIDLFLTPEHPFYEKPRPREKVCIRPAIIETGSTVSLVPYTSTRNVRCCA